jgi:hypothetical protein
MEKEDTISVQWTQEDVETSYSLVNKYYIKIEGLGLAGHVIGMEDETNPKKVLKGKFHKRKSSGETMKKMGGRRTE